MERWIFTINKNDPTVKLTVVQTVVLCTSCVTRSEPLSLFPIYWARAACDFFSAHTQKLADREEIFVDFDKKCTGLELQTRPLRKRWIWISFLVTWWRLWYSPRCFFTLFCFFFTLDWAAEPKHAQKPRLQVCHPCFSSSFTHSEEGVFPPLSRLSICLSVAERESTSCVCVFKEWELHASDSEVWTHTQIDTDTGCVV